MPKMALTLISTHRIAAAGFAVNFESHNCNILTPAPERKLIASIPQVNGLYTIAAPLIRKTGSCTVRSEWL
jgi:hypothetical protein